MSDAPRRPRLTRDAVLTGAVALADEIGVEPLTIRKLADRLGVKPMTIYHHVANKEEIIDGMVDAVFAEIEVPPPDTPWREAMRRRAVSARAALRRHPWAAGLLDSRTNPGPANLGHHDAVLANLRANGFSVATTAHVVALLDAFIYGFALQESALPAEDDAELVELADDMMVLFAEHYPSLAEFTTEHVMRPGYSFSAEFDFGLDLILDGIERALAPPPDV